MLNCREVTELCSDELDRTLGLRERMALRTHLMMCAGCTQFRAQMATMRRLMQAYAQGDTAGLGDDDAKDEGSAPR
jgi:predicted anti-sigma-YlaC factor YlaD